MQVGEENPKTDTLSKPPFLKNEWFISAGLAVLILLCYWQVWKFDFVNYDDTDYVSKNPWVQKGLSKESVAWAFTTNHASNWHPLTWLSHMLDWQIYGNNAGGHHFTNVLFHIANAILLLLLLRKMTGALWRSAIVAALFAIHPLHVESVAWISERKDVLSTFFGLWSIWFYVSYAKVGRVSPSAPLREHPQVGALGQTRPTTLLAYSLALLFFALSLMSKPMLVTLPFLLLLLDFWPLRRVFSVQYPVSSEPRGAQSEHRTLNTEYFPKLLLEKLPFLALTIASCIVTLTVQSGKTMQTLSDFSIMDRISNVLVSYAAYLGKTFWPMDLAFFYPLLGAPSAGQTIMAALILLIISSGAVLVWKKFPYLLIGWLWYLGTFVPVIGFVHVGEQAMADRYTYVPLIGIFLALVWLIADWMCKTKCWSNGVLGGKSNTPLRQYSNRFLMASANTVLIGALTFAAHRQIAFWRDSKTLLERALAVTKNNFLAHNNYGVVLAENEQFAEAIEHYQRAIEIKPHYARAYSNLGSALTMVGNLEEAVISFQNALSLRPHDAETHYNLAVTLARLGDFPGTIDHCRLALELNPNYKVAHYDLGLALSLIGEQAQAADELRKYLNAFPGDETAQKLLKRILQKRDRESF